MTSTKTLYLYGIPFEGAILSPHVGTPSARTLFLSFLPLLFCREDERVFAPLRPDSFFSDQLLFPGDHFESESLEPWGHTEAVVSFAKKHHIPYAPPPLSLVERLSSKLTSHALFPFKGGEVIYTLDQLKGKKPPFVLKAPEGFSAMHTTLVLKEGELPKITSEMPLLFEPWVERVLDFSSQWWFSESGLELLGVTELMNDRRGSYLGTHLREGNRLKSWEEEHVAFLESHLLTFWEEGFRGALGVDAFLYRDGGSLKLRPVVEINPRSTMARPLLLYRKKLGDDRPLTLQFGGKGRPLFPESLKGPSGKKILSKKQLFLLE